MGNTVFMTTDLGVASYLVAMGAELPNVRGINSRERTRCEFIFTDPEGDVEWTAQEYTIQDEHAAMVSAPRFYTAMRSLHRLMGEARRVKGAGSGQPVKR